MSYRVEAILSAVDSGFTSKFNQATKSVEKLQNQANKVSGVASKIGNATESIGRSLTTKLTLPLGVAFTYAGKQFSDFETGLVGVGKTTNMAGKDLKGFGDDIAKMSSVIPVSTNDLLGLAETAGQLGIHGKKDLLEFTRVMAEMGSATNLAGEEGAKQMARFANVMGLDVGKSIRQVGNSVVRLGNNFATSEAEIMDMSSRLAASSRLVGITTPNVLGLATAMSSVGIEAEAGGTAMSTVMTKVDKAVASGGAKLQNFAKVAGMSAEDFAAKWKSKPTEALEDLMKGLDKASKSGGNMNQILDMLGIKGVRESNAVKSLAQNHELLSEAIKQSNNAYNHGNDLAKEAAEAWKTLHAKLTTFKNTLGNIAKDIFSIVAPALKDMVDKVNELASKWFDLSDSSKKAIGEMVLKIGGLLAAIGPVLLIGGKITKTLSPVIGGLSQVGNAFKMFSGSASSALNSFTGGALSSLAKKTELSVLTAGAKLAKLSPMVGKAVSLANIGMQALFPAAVIGIALAGLGLLYSKFGTQIDKLLEVAKTKGPEIITNLGNGIANKIPDLVNQGATLINHFAQALAANLPAILTAGTNIVIALVQSVGNNAGKLIQSALLVVGSFLQGVMQNLPRLIVAGVTLIGQLLVGIVQNIPMLIATAGRIIAGFIDGLGQSLPQLLGSGIKIIFELIKGIVQAIPQIVLAGVEIVMTLGKSILGALGNIGGKLVSGVKGFFKNIFSPGKEEATNTKTDVEIEMSGLSSTLDDMTSSLGPKFQQNANQAKIGFTSEMSMMSQETQTKLQEMSNATGMSMDEIVRTVQEKGELTKGNLTIKASEMNTNVSGQTDQMANNMINSITRGVDGANTQFDGLSAKLPTDASATNQATAGQYEDLANRITSSTEQANSAVTSGIDTINSNFEMRLGTLPAKTDTILMNVSNSFTNAFNALGKGVDSNLQKIISAYSSTMAKMNSISNSGLNNLSSRFTSSFNRISATVTAGTNRIVVSITNMNNRVNASFSQFASRFIATNSNMWNRFNSQSTSALNRNYSAFSSNISKLQSKFTSYANKVKSLNNSMWTAVVNKTKQAGSSMASGFSSACNRMTSLANSMRSRLIAIMNSSVGGMRSAGYNAGMGFYSGLASTRGSIMGLASSIAASVSARIRSALRIHSPSRVLMNLGSYAGEGLAVGLEKSKRYVNNAVDGLSNTIKGVDTGLNSSFRDFNTNSRTMPLVINLRLGNKEFRAISRDITQEQGKDLILEANFGI
ncbi:MAG: phage tail tape measure protein [Anaerococcus vaginalis]|uniref:phage tail tape measure protein n=1 Tax=Anaerococcus vaginalis TaxID=33037 RepID=UPI001D4883BA|nr:phage tail tape measure protein [Anaerococcus vaginalis]MBS4889440.1 phage tail tape measure protein [Anaerococcus vaginalis]